MIDFKSWIDSKTSINKIHKSVSLHINNAVTFETIEASQSLITDSQVQSQQELLPLNLKDAMFGSS